MNTTNTPQIDREALRRDGWQVIETDEEKQATPCKEGDEYLDEDGITWNRSNNWRYSPFTFARWYTYRRRIPAPVEPAAAPASGWISTKDRLPTEADCAKKGRVIVGDTDDGWTGAMPLSDALMGKFPYWMPIPPLPEPVKPKSQEELDREEAERIYKDATIGKEHSIHAYLAGLRAGRQSDSTRARGGKGAV